MYNKTITEYKNDFKQMKQEILNFYNLYNKFPKVADFNNKKYGLSFTYTTICKIFKMFGENYIDFISSIDCFALNVPNRKYYDVYLDRLLYVFENIFPDCTSFNKLTHTEQYKKFNIPSLKWFIINCPDKNVTNTESFLRWSGIAFIKPTKEECIKSILDKAKTLNRPLQYDDFRRCNTNNFVTITRIRDYWGTFNNMKRELGLKVIQEGYEKLTLDTIEDEIVFLKEYLNERRRNFTTTDEIDSIKEIHNSMSWRKCIQENLNISLNDFLEARDIHIGNRGLGKHYKFNDGKNTLSFFEYIFSNYLRNKGFVYKRDYFRDIKYSEIDKNYNGNKNCDYKIILKDKTIVYIEIAGLLDHYKTWYYSDRVITSSKTKEFYRIGLKEKENMLKKHNLNYFILFPCDLINGFLNELLTKPSLNLKKKIESYYENNICWQDVELAS